MHDIFIRSGHGYENHSTQGRCEAFDGFDIIAAPLHQPGEGWQAAFGNEARASRIFRRPDGRGGETGTDYGSHAIKLARMNGLSGSRLSGLYILMQHGGGREVLAVPAFYDGGALEAHILAMPERLQYAMLYTLYTIASEARRQGRGEATAEWRLAIADKRIRRRKGRVEIVQQWEVDLKAEKKRRAAA
jgi:hypothetical protein